MDKVQLITFAIRFVDILSNILVFAIIARVLMSWFTMGKQASGGRITQILYDITYPVINIARKIPHRIGMIDLSPLIALIGVDLLSGLVIHLLYNLL